MGYVAANVAPSLTALLALEDDENITVQARITHATVWLCGGVLGERHGRRRAHEPAVPPPRTRAHGLQRSALAIGLHVYAHREDEATRAQISLLINRINRAKAY